MSSNNHFVKELKRWYRVITNPTLSFSKYLYYNYFCRNIKIKGESRIIPSKHVIMNLSRESRIIVDGVKDLQLGFNQLKGSKSETHIRLNGNAVWNCNNGGWIFYNTVIEVKENAVLDTGFFSMNGGSVVLVDKHITIGEDAMFGRNVIIYDSDFHTIYDTNGVANNYPKDVVIGPHVWLTTNIMVLKGTSIGEGALVAANTVIAKDIPEGNLVTANSVGKPVKEGVSWNRDRCPR